MNSMWFSPSWITFFVFLSIWSSNRVHCQSNMFVVTDYGAVSDGKTDNKQNFLDAWKKACQTAGGTFVIPSGTYLLSVAQFAGPCNGQTKVLINGTLQASTDPTLTPNDYWINFYKINGLTVYGSGTLDGNGASAWGQRCPTCKIPPTSLKISFVTNGIIQDISSVNSKFFHIDINDCEHMALNNLHITAPGDSPNTDGIHIGRSTDVRINKAGIATGDDCVSLGDGSMNISITGVNCGPGHGISIGSLGRYQAEKDVGYINVTSCILTNTTNGLRIKTFAPSPSSNVYNVTYEHITLNNVNNPIIIDQHYCPASNCAKEGESSVGIKGVKYMDVKGSSAIPIGVNIQCSKIKPCQDIEFSGLNLNFKGQPTTASCSNAVEKFTGTNQVPSQCSSLQV